MRASREKEPTIRYLQLLAECEAMARDDVQVKKQEYDAAVKKFQDIKHRVFVRRWDHANLVRMGYVIDAFNEAGVSYSDPRDGIGEGPFTEIEDELYDFPGPNGEILRRLTGDDDDKEEPSTTPQEPSQGPRDPTVHPALDDE
jgi:hypothetical protein